MKIRLDGVFIQAGRRNQFQAGPIDLVLGCGMHAVIGPNGSGKSTLLKVLSKVAAPCKGTISYELEEDVLNTHEVKLRMGYVPQEVAIYEDMTLRKYLSYIAELKCLDIPTIADEVYQAAATLGLSDLLSRPLRELSVGQQRRAMIAQALLGHPSFLIMDEPYVGLDLEQRRNIHFFLQEYAEQAIVVVCTHFVEEFQADDYDQVIRLTQKQNNRVSKGEPLWRSFV